MMCLLLLTAVAVFLLQSHAFTTTTTSTTKQCQHCTTTTTLFMNQQRQQRENEIRRKILKLKRQGRIKKTQEQQDIDEIESDDEPSSTLDKLQRKRTSAADDYRSKLSQKLGTKKTKMVFGLDQDDDESEDDDDDEDSSSTMASVIASKRAAQLGSLSSEDEDDSDEDEDEDDVSMPPPAESSTTTERQPIIDPSLFETDEPEEEEMDEQDLVELVAQKLKEQSERKRQEEAEEARRERERLETRTDVTTTGSTTPTTTTTTSGVGGTWQQKDETVETYQPKSGSWGAFPRPKDISKAYGGGRRVGAGITPESIRSSTESTRERLKQYRERVGIDVQSEKDHAGEIEEALNIAGYAMQRGMYSTAVSALEKVTKYCSTNSKVGGNVFLELAMAYEAEGRTKEAVTVYTTLTKCRIEEIKFNAKRLLYGIEAMQFMRNEAQSAEFSRKKIRNTFADTTGLANIAQNFDDVYETAYIDLDSGFYRRLTESVVRTNREARQILLQATGHEKVEHMKIVQALRSLARHFDSSLEEEEKKSLKPVAVMDGKPIVEDEPANVATLMTGMDEYVLLSPEQMLSLLNGQWKLQLVADRQGDGVKYDNSTLQVMDTESMTFVSRSPSSFSTVRQSGGLEFDNGKRILSREKVQTSGQNVLSGLFGGSSTPEASQQVVLVDSVLLVTRRPAKKNDNGKGFFSVWRRVGGPVDETEEDAMM